MREPSVSIITRPVLEGYAASAWLLGAILLVCFARFLPLGILLWSGAVLLGLAGFRGRQAFALMLTKVHLHAYPLDWIGVETVLAWMRRRPDALLLGYGFTWGVHQTQAVYDIRAQGEETTRAPLWFWRFHRRFARKPQMHPVGQAWIHGLGKETEAAWPMKALEGNTLIVGTPGSGKTRLLELILVQAVHRGDIVIAVDPKGDQDLEHRLRAEAKRAGRPYVYFHPAHAAKSVRFSPLAQWNRPTEIASRLGALIPSETGGDAFSAFGWMVLEAVANGQLMLGEQPTIKSLKYYIQWGPDELLERVLTFWLDKHAPGWERTVSRTVEEGAQSRRGLTRIQAMSVYYKDHCAKKTSEIDSLVGLVEHNREHYGKMILNLLPVLDMLTAGDLGPLLSPDPGDHADAREIWDMTKVIRQDAVCYVGLDTLSDGTVGSAIGSMLMSECASAAGAIYNFETAPKRVTVAIDEAAEVLNAPTIQLVNKARGAKFEIFACTQTYSDLAAKMASEAKGRMFAGNFNNLIVLRTRDGATQKYCVEQFGEVAVTTLSRSHSSNSGTKEAGIHWSGSQNEATKPTQMAVFPADLLGQLPTLHYIAISGGRLTKGRLPMLLPPE
jgi:conjugal transfer pilus assembly protein TraD